MIRDEKSQIIESFYGLWIPGFGETRAFYHVVVGVAVCCSIWFHVEYIESSPFGVENVVYLVEDSAI